MKTFNVKDRQAEINEDENFITLSSDGSLDFRVIREFENKFNCSFFNVMPYTKYGGASWISLTFIKIKEPNDPENGHYEYLKESNQLCSFDIK